MMTKRMDMRLGNYAVIGEVAEDGTVSVRIEHAVDRHVEANLTFGVSDRKDEPASAAEREMPGPGDADRTSEEAAPPGRVQAQSSEPHFAERPGMKRSLIGPSPEA